MAQVVCRIRKLKDYSAIGAADVHNLRPVGGYAHAAPNGLAPVTLVGKEDSLVELVKSRIGDRTIRKNAVLAVELVLSASPEYFRPDAPDEWGKFDKERTQSWVKAQHKWLVEQFGKDNLVSMILHLDEATPHVHAVIVPINPQDRLAASHWFDGPAKMRALQDSAAAAVKHLGIERGEPFSQAEHQDLQELYRAAARLVPELPPVKSKAPAPLPPAGMAEKLPFGVARQARDELERQHAQATAKHQVETSRQVQAMKANYPTLARQAKLAKSAEARAKAAEARAKAAEEKYRRLKAETDKIRALALPEVLARLYGAAEARDSKPGYKSRLFELPDGSMLGISGELWVDNSTGKGGRGPVDLVMHLSNCDFKGAIRLLREGFTAEAAAATMARVEVERVHQEVKADTVPPPLPEEAPNRWPPVREWLTNVRGMPGALVDKLKSEGLIYANRFAGCVFRRQHGGCAVRGIGQSTFKQTLGKAETCGGFAIDGPGEIWICEGPLDAVAIKSAHPDAYVLATLGAAGMAPELVARSIPKGRPVTIAPDGDQAGQARGAMLQVALSRSGFEISGTVPAPGAKDWAEAVKQAPQLIDSRWLPPAITTTKPVEAAAQLRPLHDKQHVRSNNSSLSIF